ALPQVERRRWNRRAAPAPRSDDDESPGRGLNSRRGPQRGDRDNGHRSGHEPEDPGSRADQGAAFTGPPPYLAPTVSMYAAHRSAMAALWIWTTFSAFCSPLWERLK